MKNGYLLYTDEEDFLEDIYEWDQDAMDNFQAELQNIGKDIDIDELKNCERVIELMKLID